MTSPLRVGVIGTGRIGKLHTENLVNRIPDVTVTAVADPNLPAAEQTAQRFRIAHAVADYRALLAMDVVDAVAICSASATHPQVIKDAAAAGKHIFCEKPIGFELDMIDDVLAAVAAAGVKFQVGFNRRFDPNFHRVRQRVAAGDVGTPHVLRITSRDPEAPPPDYLAGWGGIFKETTIHDFDMARFIMGSEVEKVYTAGGVRDYPVFADKGDLDTVLITLHFTSGAVGTIDNSYNAVYGYDQRLEVFGSNGMVRVENERPDVHEYVNRDGFHRTKPFYFFLDRYVDSYRIEMEAFVRSVLDDTTPPVTGLDGRAPIAIAMAAQQSFDEGRPVALSEIA